jgi:hypothetical protein
MADIKDWSITASGNADASPSGAQSGWQGKDVGPWARETMAAVARLNADPGWTNFTFDGIPPSDTIKSVSYASGNTIRLQLPSGSWPSNTAAKFFPAGRLIRIEQSGGNPHVYGFVSSSTSTAANLDVTIAPIGMASIPTGSTYVNNGIEFYVGMENYSSTETPYQMLGVSAFGGYGTTTERDAKYNASNLDTYPDGITWCNTTLDTLQVLHGISWKDIAPLYDAWTDGGATLKIAPTGAAASLNVGADLYSQSTGYGSLKFFTKNSTTSAYDQRGSIISSSDGNYVLMEAPREDEDGVLGTFSRVICYGANHPTEAGKLWFTSYENDGNGSPVILENKNLTPGELDAGTLGGSNLAAVTEASYSQQTRWNPANTGVSTGQDAGNYVSLGRYAFPQGVIDSQTGAASGTLSCSIEIRLDGTQSPYTTWNDAYSQYGKLNVYIGPDYGDANTSITGFPLTSPTINLTPVQSGGTGTPYRLVGTVTGLSPSPTMGMAISVKRTGGANNSTYFRISKESLGYKTSVTFAYDKTFTS